MSTNKTKKVKMATKSCPECDQQVRKKNVFFKSQFSNVIVDHFSHFFPLYFILCLYHSQSRRKWDLSDCPVCTRVNTPNPSQKPQQVSSWYSLEKLHSYFAPRCLRVYCSHQHYYFCAERWNTLRHCLVNFTIFSIEVSWLRQITSKEKTFKVKKICRKQM